MADAPDDLDSVQFPPDLVRSELDRLCASPTFHQSERLKRFIRYALEMSQLGNHERLKESVIGTEVFDRALGYNPKEDAIVRVEAHRLRQKLKQYYEREGSDSRLRFVLPKGKYSILIENRTPVEVSVPDNQVLESAAGGSRKAIWVALAATAMVALTIGTWWATRQPGADARPISWRRLTLDNGFATDPVLMHDGQSVIYSADRGSGTSMALWRQTLLGGEPARLTEDSFDATKPDLSPDGNWIVYHSRDPRAPGIYRRRLNGGAPQLLVPGGQRPRYSPNGHWILYTLRNEQEWQPGRLGIVAAEGGAPVEIVSDFADAHFGIFSEDSRHILFCGTRVSNTPEQEHDWWTVEVPSDRRQLGNFAARKTKAFPNLLRHLSPGSRKIPPNEFVEQPADWLGNFIYFSSPMGNPLSGTVPLWRLPLDSGRFYGGEVAPERLTFGSNADLRARARRIGNSHRIVAANGTTSIDIWRLPLQSDPEGRLIGGQPVRATSHTDSESFPVASADGRWLVFVADRQAPRQIFLRDLTTQNERQVSPSGFAQDFPVVSPDSKRIAFRQNEQPTVPILIAETGSSKVERICDDCGAPTSWSPDGNHLLYEPGSTIAYVGRYHLGERKPEVLLRHPEYSLRGARYSPNGKWIAFYAETSREGRRIFIAPADRETPPGDWIAVTASSEIAMLPAWSQDSRQIFFLNDSAGQRTITGQRLDPVTAQPTGSHFTVQRFNSPRRSLLRLTRTRVTAVGLAVRGDQLYFALDEQLAEIFWTDVPVR